jgi:SAM-dependent methyltransferase
MTTLSAYMSLDTSSPHSALGYFRHDCRMCRGAHMETYLDLGMQPHSDGFIQEKDLRNREHFFPLVVQNCNDCGQQQLNYVVSPEFLYGEDYIYESSITETFKKHFFGMAESIVQKFQMPEGSLAVDIGSNVGLLLSGFQAQGMNVQGVDPAPNIVKIARENGVDTHEAFFSPEIAEKIVSEKGNASVMTATNVFAHVDDLDDLMEGANILLAEDGILIIEAPYQVDLIQKMLYDMVYHQHLSYLSIRPLKRFFERLGFELFDVEHTPSHGGSIRVFAGRKDKHSVQPVVAELLEVEKKEGIHDMDRLHRFAGDVLKHRQALIEMLVTIKDEGKTIVGIGAPAKGNTLLNYCGITSGILECITEKSTLKQGRYTPGTRMLVEGDEKLLELQPDYGLILPWNFAPEIMKNLSEYQDRGGKFIIPMPAPRIV